jgi:hypothetical protein
MGWALRWCGVVVVVEGVVSPGDVICPGVLNGRTSFSLACVEASAAPQQTVVLES